MKWAAAICLMCATAVAQGARVQVDGEPWSIELPAGFTEMPGAGDAKVAELRKQPQMRKANVRAYTSGSIMLSVMYAEVAMGDDVSWHNLEEMDRGATESLGEQTDHTAHTTLSQRVGNQLVTEVTADAAGGHVEMRSLYMADSAGNIHWLMSQCVAPPTDTATCRTAQHSLKLVVLDAVIPPEHTRSTEYRVGYLIGRLALPLIAIVVVIVIIRRTKRKRA